MSQRDLGSHQPRRSRVDGPLDRISSPTAERSRPNIGANDAAAAAAARPFPSQSFGNSSTPPRIQRTARQVVEPSVGSYALEAGLFLHVVAIVLSVIFLAAALASRDFF